MFVKHRFFLDEYTKDLLYDMEPKFGYEGFGEFIFYRTYSRVNKEGKQETWSDVVIRVIEGTMSIRKDWYLKTRVSWNEKYWQELARNMAVSMFNMEWLPPGRGLWAMGTDFIYERGGMSLANCGYTDITDNFEDDFAWLMNVMMVGVGVGFTPFRNDNITFKNPRGSYEHVIEDSKEGWINSLIALFQAYKYGASKPEFVYDEIRLAGLPIRGFGGISSGPKPLIYLHQQIEENIDLYMTDPYYDSVIFKTDCANQIGTCIVSGNVRRSAELSCLSIKDPIFKDLKNYSKYPRRSEWGWMSNNSVDLEDDEDFDLLPEIAQRIALNGEPGIKNLRNFPKGRLGKKDKVKKDRATGVNACIISDTLILTADGKGFVKFKDLLDEDINVFCINDEDEICIRKMRNPRLTGYNQKILKIIFDNKDSIRVSETHKFMLRDRSFVEAKDLKMGDRLAVVRRYIPESCQGKSYWDKYISLSYSGDTVAEHKLIAEDKFGHIFDSEHVHHINEDKLDNDPNNLEIKECFNHLSEHSVGEENGNWSGYSNEQIIRFGVELAKKLGRRFSINEWRKFGFIQLTSEYRRNKLGSFEEFAYYCADIAEVKNEPVDTRMLRSYLNMIDKGYDTEIRDKQVFVKKICEGCKNEFWIEAGRREQASCSLSCNNTIRDYSKNTETNRKIWAQKKKNLQEKQLEVYYQLKNNLDRLPTKSEWVQSCKDAEISFEISRDSSPFRSWEDLKCNAQYHNHKVLAVIEDGYEDVYNGTVDEFHNFIIGGWESITPFGRKVQVGVVTPQCGEQLLEHRETCIIDETFPTICNDPEIWLQACEYATLYCSTVSLLPTDQPSTNEVVGRNRRIGVGIVDFTGWVADMGMSNVIKYLRKGYKRVRKTNRHYNGEAGVPEAIRVTTVKPGGTVPKLSGKTSGAMYPNFHYMIRRARVARNSPIHEILVQANIPYEPDLVSQNTDVFEFPLPTNPNVPQAGDVSIWQQAMNLIILQREWSDNSVSNTLNFRPKWVLIKHWEEDIEDQLRNWYDPHQQNQYETNAFIQSIYLCEEYIAGKFKLNIKWDLEQDIIEELKIYEFDPRHEEDALEAVLASIAPVIKTASILPATSQGVYEQMPESGITKEEYEERKSLIKHIDWSKLSGSMGQDEKFCTGESCEILRTF